MLTIYSSSSYNLIYTVCIYIYTVTEYIDDLMIVRPLVAYAIPTQFYSTESLHKHPWQKRTHNTQLHTDSFIKSKLKEGKNVGTSENDQQKKKKKKKADKV